MNNCEICNSDDVCTKCEDGYISNDEGGCNKGRNHFHRADPRFAPSQWETALLCNDVSHWLGANLGSAISPAPIHPLLLMHDPCLHYIDFNSRGQYRLLNHSHSVLTLFFAVSGIQENWWNWDFTIFAAGSSYLASQGHVMGVSFYPFLRGNKTYI